MTRYWIKYKTITSETESHSVYCLESELSEKLEELLYHFEAMIDWIGEKLEGQKDYHEVYSKFQILKKFGLDNKNQENEDRIFNEWGY